MRRSGRWRRRIHGCFFSLEMAVRQPHYRQQKKEHYRAAEEQSS
jgi:hypothetical protein